MSDEPKPPRPRGSTLRDAIRAELEYARLSAHQISIRVGIREKDVAEHLEHLARSLRAHGGKLEVRAAKCAACAFSFETRARFTTPSRCPSCSSERIDPPEFRVRLA